MTRADYRRLAATHAQPAVPLEVVDEPSLVEAVAVAVIVEAVAAATDAPLTRRARRAATAPAIVPTASDVVDDVTPAGDLPEGSVFTATAEPECHVDEFEFAARLFSFTSETPVQAAAVEEEVTPAPVRAADIHVVPRKRRARGGAFAQRLAAASFSIGVMTIVGLLAIGTTTPAAAVASGQDLATDLTVASSTKVPAEEIQAFVTSSSASATGLDRTESYDVASMADVAADSGVTIFAGTWVNDSEAAIQWPFPVGVPISAAFGSTSYLSQFALPHRGVDLTPGAGAEVHAVAAGTVRIATEAGGDYGVTVLIDHEIDGQLVSTRYGHMQYGSLSVEQGDIVAAGEVVGAVGQTGKATGPHLHLEVLLGGATRVDPMPWLYEHTNG